jgi:hypothetical protein
VGLIFVVVLGSVTAIVISIFGYSPWVMVVLGILWLAALVVSALGGHHGFGGRENTDLLFTVAGIIITAALIIPNYAAQKPCNQAKTVLKKIVDAENMYYSEHTTYTNDPKLLRLTVKPEIFVYIIADKHSCTASVSHSLCDEDNNGESDIIIWNSARGRLP